MKKFFLSFFIVLVLLSGINKFALAEEIKVNLTVKNNGEVVYSGDVALLPSGIIGINDSSGNPHDTNADGVLSIVNTADASRAEFNISNLIYYNAFGAFYLKCVSVSGSELCDNWQYKVDGVRPEVGMDSKILSGGENVVLYFGDENKAPEPETPPVYSSSGSGGFMATLSIPPAPVPLPSPPIITSPSPSTNLEEKSEKPAVVVKIPKKRIKKQALTATVINAIPLSPSPNQPTEIPQRNWFLRLLDKIFRIF